MYKFFSVPFFLIFLFSSCNNNDAGETLLEQPPFDKLTDSIRQSPNNAELFYHRGSLLYLNNQLAYAEQDLRQAWLLAPKQEYALSIITLLKEKNTDSAILFLQEASKKIPGSIALQIGLAKGFQQKNQPEKALAICDDVIAKYPNQIDAMLLKSEILETMNKDDEAIAVLEKAYAYAPFDVDLVHKLAFKYADSKNKKALLLADSLIKADKKNRHAEPYYFKGLYYENMGNASEAIKFFDNAISHDFYFIDAYMDKGQTLYNQKKYEAALTTFSLATTVSPTYAPAYYWMGKTQEAMGNKTEAKLNYQRAYGLDKTITEAKEAAEKI